MDFIGGYFNKINFEKVQINDGVKENFSSGFGDRTMDPDWTLISCIYEPEMADQSKFECSHGCIFNLIFK